jgi:hypothetical protein
MAYMIELFMAVMILLVFWVTTPRSLVGRFHLFEDSTDSIFTHKTTQRRKAEDPSARNNYEIYLLNILIFLRINFITLITF